MGAAVAVAMLVPLAAVACSWDHRSRTTTAAAPTFQRNVAPILREKCTGCHQTGGIAPFSLVTAKQAHDMAPAIATAVGGGMMPPWPPGPASPPFVGQDRRTLTAAQRATIVRWAKRGGHVSGAGPGKLPPAKPDVRAGERLLSLAMPSVYKPTSRNGATDDYRCFLLDPKLAEDGFATSASIAPGARSVVHHVILFRIAAAEVGQARELDASSAGEGWSCFGGIGMGPGMAATFLDDAPWIAAWAPGWGSGRLPEGTGIPMPAGSEIVMQVHYNLLNGRAPDRSRALLTVTPAAAALKPLETMLLPAPVELACVKGEKGPLCSRDRALAALGRKYGSVAPFVPPALLALCGQNAVAPKPSRTSTCDRRLDRPGTIYVVAGHMHLLGKSIRVELNPGTPNTKVLLDIPDWHFHWQNAYTLEQPVRVAAGDVLRVTCRYDPTRRRRGAEGVPRTPRYILWGEGSTDEMCLGLVQVTRG
jgi:hypothetical protein